MNNEPTMLHIRISGQTAKGEVIGHEYHVLNMNTIDEKDVEHAASKMIEELKRLQASRTFTGSEDRR